MIQLTNCNEDTPLFSLNGIDSFGKIVSNYDGDTCDIVLAIPFLTENTRFKCRLNGIDCAEIKSVDPDEKNHAKLAKNFVKNWHNDDILYVKCHRFDKYGRLLVDVYNNTQSTKSLSQILIENGLAYEYSGKTKKEFKDWFRPIIVAPKAICSNVSQIIFDL